MKALKYILALSVAAVVFSCYEDKGNYVYNEDIHDISVKLNSTYTLRKSGDVMNYTITPEITTVDGDKSSLEYLWTIRNNTTYVEDTLCLTENAELELDTNADDFSYSYNLYLYVTDTKTGGVTMVPTKIEIGMPFSYSWIVLHETDGHAELGTVEYIVNEMMVLPDVYTQEAGQSLTGKPRNLSVVHNGINSTYWLGCTMPSQVYVTTTNPDESGWVDQTNHFKLMVPWKDAVLVQEADKIDFENMETSGDEKGLLAVSKGNVFCNTYTSVFMKALEPSSEFEGDYYITKIASGPHTAIGYDELGQRFVHLTTNSGLYWYGPSPSDFSGVATIAPVRNSGDNAADPNNLPAGEKVICFVNGYQHARTGIAPWQRYTAYAYSLDDNGKSHVYVFRYRGLTASDIAPMPFRFTFETPEGINENTPMTSSHEYNNVIFYGAGNKIYRLDVSTGAATVIYTHANPAAEVVDVKMAIEGYVDSSGHKFNDGASNYGHPYSRCLGAAFNVGDDSGELVVLQLNSAGKVDEDKKFPSTQVHQGFGKITEIAFF